MNQNAEQPTVIVELNGDVFREKDLEASQEILEPQFRVEGEIYLTAIEEGFIGPIISGSIDIIVSQPTRDILLALASNALYDAVKYMVTKAKGTSTKVNFSLKRNTVGDVLFEADIDTNAPDALEQIPQVLQQASDAVRRLSDDD